MGGFQLDLNCVARIKYALHLRNRPVQQVAFHKAVKFVKKTTTNLEIAKMLQNLLLITIGSLKSNQI